MSPNVVFRSVVSNALCRTGRLVVAPFAMTSTLEMPSMAKPRSPDVHRTRLEGGGRRAAKSPLMDELGKNLTPEQVIKLARDGARLALDPPKTYVEGGVERPSRDTERVRMME